VTGDPWAVAREQVRDELAAQKVRQADMAAALGVSTKHICQVLTGRSESPTMLARIAGELGLVFALVEDPARVYPPRE
jgi:transcriptional regulator with XRE-family HTH domain